MEFDAFETLFVVVLFMMALGLGIMAINHFGKNDEQKSIDDLIASALEGTPGKTKFTPPLDFNFCEQYGGSLGCEEGKTIGVEPSCRLEIDKTYILDFIPSGNQEICINISVI